MAFKSSKSGSKTKGPQKSSSAAQQQQQLPPSLASELLLMQFIGGGSIERHAKRVMEQQARDTAPDGSELRAQAPAARAVLVESQPQPRKKRFGKKSKTTALESGPEPEVLPVAQAFRDENGNVWWDEHEAAEYRGLLTSTAQALEEYDQGGDDERKPSQQAWVSFDTSSSRSSQEMRRASLHNDTPTPLSTAFSTSEFPRVHFVTPPPSLIDSDPFYSPYSGCSGYSSDSAYSDSDIPHSESISSPDSGKENEIDASVDRPLSRSNQSHVFEDTFAPAALVTSDSGDDSCQAVVSMKVKGTGLNLRGRAKAFFSRR